MIEQVNITKSYKYYRQQDPSGVPGLDYKKGMPVYIKIVSGLMKFIMQKVFEGNDVVLGAKLGKISIRGEKVVPIIVENKETGEKEIRGVAPNWGETKKLQARDEEAKRKRTIVYCFNEHSNGIKYEFVWDRVNVLIKNKNYYQLTFSYDNRRELTRLIYEGKEYQLRPKKEEYVRPSSYTKIENKD